jgi:hypothetical protein
MESAHRRWLESGGRASPQPFPAVAVPTYSSLSIRSPVGGYCRLISSVFAQTVKNKVLEAEQMTRKEKITRRGTIIILAMTILSVTGSVSALPDLCYGGGGHFGPKTVSPGQLFDIWFSVDNKGDADAGHFSVNFYVSTDTTITASDYYIGKYSIGNLPAGSSWIGEWLRSFPGGIPAGEYYVGYIIDADNEVEESDETNNT